MSFKDNLKDELKYQDIRIKELSEKTQISIGTLNHYLAERNSEPTVENAVSIAQALNVSVEYLVTGKASTPSTNDIFLVKKYHELLTKIENLQPESYNALINLIDNLK